MDTKTTPTPATETQNQESPAHAMQALGTKKTDKPNKTDKPDYAIRRYRKATDGYRQATDGYRTALLP